MPKVTDLLLPRTPWKFFVVFFQIFNWVDYDCKIDNPANQIRGVVYINGIGNCRYAGGRVREINLR